ncbi:hypothetical protein RHMOL_Rhmol05G0308800 [Rhododendron molle]|uniref:Uncharacterized protein n=1 Tax=Rhododendron molle TaxID=49168 RepID=A0ACC0NVS9_RHOML|nr:hypothetical protein RHMOL_Rhmol05G0308800 [Rhododendron molle]
MRPSAIRSGQVQFQAAKGHSMRSKVIRCSQVQFDVTKSNSRPRVILCGHE